MPTPVARPVFEVKHREGTFQAVCSCGWLSAWAHAAPMSAEWDDHAADVHGYVNQRVPGSS